MTRYRKFLRCAGLAGLLAVFSAAAMATPVTWTLTGASFTDGGKATGYFIYDVDTNTISDFSVNTFGGDTTNFPPIGYNPASASPSIDSQGAGVLGTTLTIGNLPPSSGQRQIRMPAVMGLSDSGGSVGLNLLSNAQGECYNCTPYRFFSSGALIGTLPPTIVTGNSAVFRTDTNNSFGVTATGLPLPSISVSGLLPNGLLLVDNGNGNARLLGRPTQTGTYLLTITASNGTSPNATQEFLLSVVAVEGVSQAPALDPRGVIVLALALCGFARYRLRTLRR